MAAQRNGITPVWSSEIEIFPLEVTKRRFPNVKQLGDVTQIDGSKIEPVDIITSGSPCQNFSQAGDRRGLCGSESRLFYESVRIVRQMRLSTGGIYPRYYIFENVPGTLTSNAGMDFRIILESITDSKIPIPRSGRWATAGMVRSRLCDVGWRCIDAQYLGVAQRRNRLWIICDFAETGRNIAQILFEQKSLQGNLEEEQGTGQGVAIPIEEGFGDSSRIIPFDTTQITSKDNFSNPKPGDPCHPLCAGGHPPAIAYDGSATWDDKIKEPICLRMRAGKEGGGKGALLSYDKAMSLRVLNDQIMFEIHHTDDIVRFPSGNKANCLQARMGTGGNQVPLIYSIQGNMVDRESKQHGWGISENISCTLTESDRHAIAGVDYVRRLTPIEAERLQGLPDNWTLIDHKSCTDSARYRALGNGMAQPVPDFLLRRLVECSKNKPGRTQEILQDVQGADYRTNTEILYGVL